MLEILNRHSHGLVVVPFVDALRKSGCLSYMASCERFSATEITQRFGLNAGYLAVALRMLLTCRWIARVGAEDYRVTPEFEAHALVPADIMSLYAFPYEGYVNGTAKRSLERWIERSGRRWDAGDSSFADYLDGVFMIPLLLALKQHGKLKYSDAHDGSRVALRCELTGLAREEVLRLLSDMRWLERKGRSLWLLPAGIAMLERIAITAALASYRRMFAQTQELLSGDPGRVFTLDRFGHEKHLDRTLNVVGSGFQHQRYFTALSEFVHKCFDDADLAAQPKYLADTGCGDGTLLRRLYETVKKGTRRGRALNRYPLTLIAVDWNEKALQQSAATLAGLPHLVLKGDIGDPASIMADLERRGIAIGEVLHVRSFLDHDRPYLPPADTDEAQRRCGLVGSGVFIDRAGGSIALRDVVQSTVEHLRRWAGVLDRNGLMMLEVHSLDAERGARFADEAESLHFDAYHAMSRQFLLDARTFVLAAGEAGLFCAANEWESFPRRMQFTRITLNHFLQRPFRVRHARPDECATLAQAQPLWREPAHWQALAAPLPDQTLVLLRDGHIAAAIDWNEPPLAMQPVDAVELDGQVRRIALQRAWASDFQGVHDCSELLQFARHYLLVDKSVTAFDGLDECNDTLAGLRAGKTPTWRHVVDEMSVAASTAAFPAECDPRGWEAELADFAFSSIARWLHGHRVCVRAGERHRVADLLASLGIASKYSRYFHSLLSRLEERGGLRQESDEIVVLAGLDAAHAPAVFPSFDEFERRFAQRHPHAAPFARFMLPCLQHFDDIVSGRIAAAAVMFPDGDMDAFAGIFDGEPIATYFNRLVAVAASAAVAGARTGERAGPVRIVEIGAGTGGTTLPVLRELHATSDVDYLFTDISPAFLRRARNRFGDAYPFVQFQQLDIERDAAVQGFAPGAHAVAIAANVLHDTRDIVWTLRQVRRLLAPGGVLLLTEYTEVKPWLFFSGALLHGMWLFEDDARRLPQFCLLGVAQWRRALEDAGFTDIEVFALPTQSEAHCGQCVIVCRASDQQLAAETMAVAEPDALAAGTEAAPSGDAGQVPSPLAARVRDLILDTLGTTRMAAYHGDRPLMQLGLDSVEMVELKGALGRTVGLKLSPAFLFEHETADKIASALAQMLSPEQLRALQTASVDSAAAAVAPETAAPAPVPPPPASAFPLAADRAIAVVGIACRLPGAENAQAFWELLRDGGQVFGSLGSRWQWPANIDPHGSHAGIDRAGLLPRIDAFDADFFQISPREAELMDPQQRLLLELSWEVMERSGYRPAQLATRRTGVFVGACHNDYRDLLARATSAHDAYVGTGSALSMLANRLSFFYDFRGPSVSIDTACSSSLVALERAVHALRSGECEHALLAAVNLICSPVNSIAYYESGMLSRSGICRAFDRDADGFVRGEGAVALLLKPLRQALADRDLVHGVILGAAVGHGGRAASLTAPKPASQAAVIEAALRDAGVDADRVQFVETHGTGTQLGDVVEMAGLQQAFRRARSAQAHVDPTHRCGIGSVKTHIGHLESAAGLAGVVKVLLSMRHAMLPASRNFETPNPDIDFRTGPFELVTRTKAWAAWRDAAGHLLPRIAGVSSFGFGGVNAHVVLCEAIAAPLATEAMPRREIIVLSAKSVAQLNARVAALLGDLAQGAGGATLRDIAYTLQAGREPMDCRLAVGVESIADLRRKLTGFLAGAPFDGHVGEARPVSAGSSAAQLRHAVARWCEHTEETELCRLWVQGHEVDWEALHAGEKPRRVELSAYPFARERHWIASGPADPDRSRPLRALRARRWAPVVPRAGLADGESAVPPQRRVVLCRPAAMDEQAFLVLESMLRSAGTPCEIWTWDTEDAAEGFERFGWHVLCCLQAMFADKPRDEVMLQVAYPESARTELLRGLSGMLKTAQLENPQVRAQLVGLEPDGAAPAWKEQLDLCAAMRIVDIRYRGGVCESEDSVALDHGLTRMPWRAGATYLITGGAGGLGLAFADEILRQAPGARVVLAGRSELTHDKAARLAEWGRLGLRVDYLRADLSRRDETQALLDTIAQQHGAIDGVIHCAGVVRDGYILNKQPDAYAQVMASKVRSVVHLDEAIGAGALDFFVQFSSAAGVTGNVGQSDYAAANAFLDAYACLREQRVRQGQRQGRSLSIAWPWWATQGMQVPTPLQEQWIAQGIRPLQPAEGIAAFYAAYASDGACIEVVGATSAPVAGEIARASRPRLAAPLASLRERTRQRLKDLLAEVTKLSASRIDANAPLERYGIDSMMVMRLNARLAADFGALSKTLFYEYSTLDALGDYLTAQHPEACARWCELSEAGAETGLPAAAQQAPRERDAARAHEPIAVIGLSGRYAGGRDLRAYWENLRDGRDCIGEIPPERWSLEGFYDPDVEEAAARGRCYGKWGGFIEGFSEFDAQFFGIAPRDADLMDPQERLFLQASWEAMEDAGYTRQSLATRHDRRVGVFVGVTKTGFDLYGPNLWQSGKALTLHTSFASMANRVSYVLNLQGPSMPVDTMCSASLVAIHEGCEHLLRSECEIAICGGVNVYLHPSNYLYLGATHMLAPDGRCRAFGADAGGFVPGEGVGAVLLKRLSSAQADGDFVHGVIRATGVNHGGKTNGYTVPNPVAQRELIAATLAKAGVDARTVSYIEAHGTGTVLGDPIEITGLAQAFARQTADTQFCAIGSVKSNIGHAESAAGIAGLTKVLLQMKHRQLVPSLHAAAPNPNIDFAATPFVVQQTLTDWPRPRLNLDGAMREYPRVAGISSFGAGGTNAHVIVEEYIEARRANGESAVGSLAPVVIVLSARNAQRLTLVAERLLDAIDTEGFDDRHLADIAYTLQVGRETMECRLAFTVASMQELRERLRGFSVGDALASGAYFATLPADFIAAADTGDLIRARLANREYRGLCELWANGGAVDWQLLHSDAAARRIPLPTYPFEQTRYWIAAKGEVQVSAAPGPRDALRKPQGIRLRKLDAAGHASPKHAPVPVPVPVPVPEATVAVKVPLAASVREAARPAVAVRTAAPERLRIDRSVLQAELTRTLAEALFMDPSDVDPRKSFAEMGLDSIIGVEWVRVINRRYALQMVAARIYDYPNVERLAQYLAQQLEQCEPAVAVPATAPARPRIDRSALQAELTRTLAEALFMDPSDVDPRKSFAEMGLDSIIGVEWVRVINRRYALQMVAARIYDYPNVERLAQYLAQQLEQREPDFAGTQEFVETPALSREVERPVVAPASAQPVAGARLVAEPEAIAIVGMSGRYPQAPDLDTFWRNLSEGRDSVEEIPAWRWDAQRYFDPRPNLAGSIYCKWLGAIEDVAGFDPLFFGISPAEAEMMDPQHRLFVQESYRAFEDAGYDPRSLGDSRCGVYLGIMSNDYATLLQARGMASDSTGNSAAIAAARISYILDLKGPAISIDTACSSSLVATHLACQALRNGEVDMALAGGVTLYLTPGPYLSMCAAGMLSPQGRCKTLDNSANGFVPGEGVGALLLKRLSEAEAAGDPIHGVIVGSGINQDGKTNGITAPSANRQGELHREVYARYGIDPKTIGYVEMHGTGTQLGDPIELEALLSAYGAAGVAKNACGLGSVKSNIGHASAAAGIAGVHKVLLQMRHRQLAPTLHFNSPNAHFDFANSPFYANTALRAWEPLQGRRRAAVSSFGHSGTNAHLVVEEYVAPAKVLLAQASFAVTPARPAVVVLSARTEERLRVQAQRLLDAIAARAFGDADLASVAYTLQVGREGMEHRLGFTAGTMQELTQRLQRFADGEPSVDGLYRGEVKRNREALLLFGGDEELQEATAKWLERGKYAKVLDAWVKGMAFDWKRLYPHGTPRTMSLPTYPFANERYWLPLEGSSLPVPLSIVGDGAAAFVAAEAPPLPDA
ncbi:SDR family NAD(P)-dependent oxidoreductase, partial [Tahibacter sp.]|uniref:SDR family NAD(P)-dependent oxidoreductase n=1 Tax=Tahibacter sp. TaxID=2056211 RepID=UPI0028C49674